MPGVFVVGCLERHRVTLYSQQVRALNLIYALCKLNRLTRDKRVAIIGGGGAGLTAAAAAHIVTSSQRARRSLIRVLERNERKMHMQRGCTTRWLHPHVYEWPREGSLEPTAGLPLMDWTAGTADQVVRYLDKSFHDTVPMHEKVVHCGVTDIELARVQGRWRLLWNESRKNERHNEVFDLVILALGFGVERRVSRAHLVSYWHIDSLGQSRLDPREDRVLVSGTGDGGLIDALRAKLSDFDHTTLVENYLEGRGMAGISSKLLAIDEQARREREPGHFLEESYRRLSTPWIDRKLLKNHRSTKVTLLGRDPTPYSLGTAIINRFLVSRLLRLGLLTYRVGSLEFLEHRSSANGYEARIVGVLPATMGRVEKEEFEMVMVRHGAESALEQQFPPIVEEMKKRQISESLLHEPAWPAKHFEQYFDTKKERRPRIVPDRGKLMDRKPNVGEPELCAQLMLDRKGVPRSFEGWDARHYWMRLYLKNAPPLREVVYRLHETFPERELTVRAPFEVEIASYGDFVVKATLIEPSKKTTVSRTLSAALKCHHGDPTSPVKKAITSIANH